MKTVLKVLTALAAVIGTAYVLATYGDKIVAWAKKLLNSCPFCACTCEVVEEDFAPETPVEEAPAEVPAEEPVPEAEAEVKIVIEDTDPVAEDSDFEA